MLSLVSNPNQLLNPAHTETIPCEYLSLETLERWIIFGFAICHTTLQQNQTANELWVLALSSGWVISRIFQFFSEKNTTDKDVFFFGYVIGDSTV